MMEIKTTHEIRREIGDNFSEDFKDGFKKWVSVEDLKNFIVEKLKDDNYTSKNELAGLIFKKCDTKWRCNTFAQDASVVKTKVVDGNKCNAKKANL